MFEGLEGGGDGEGAGRRLRLWKGEVEGGGVRAVMSFGVGKVHCSWGDRLWEGGFGRVGWVG